MNDQSYNEVLERLNDRDWRLNNLYWIKDKHGQKVLLKLNKFQQYLLKRLWYLNLILKSRQLGITTFTCILFLDSVLFQANKHAGIIAHTREDAENIFEDKIKFPFDNLPSWLQKEFVVNQDNIRELRFKNGSSIRVGTSLRSSTLQYLLVSEFGIICQRYPEKAKEIMTGSLNTVALGQMVIIESTAKGREGYYYDMFTKAYSLEKSKRRLTDMDYKFFFFPWWQEEKYALEGYVMIPKEKETYFKNLEDKNNIKLTEGQKRWYVKKSESQGDEMTSEYPSYPEEAFKASIEGSYYGKYIDAMYAEKRVREVPYDHLLPVHTYWDLGVGDSNSIIFAQFYHNEVRIIDYYESSGEGLQHYAKILKNKPYVYGSHTAPHDIKVRELSTGKSRLEIARGLGINFKVGKRLSVEDGIESSRMLLTKLWIDEVHCAHLLKALTAYRKEWDDKLGSFKDIPFHNWASHGADAFRLMATSYREESSYEIKEEQDGRSESFDRHAMLAEI